MRGLQVLLMGRPRLELDGQALGGLVPAKQQALVYLLALERQPVLRHRAAALLWGGQAESAAKASLRVALSQLRRWLPGLLVVDAREFTFAPDAAVSIDLVELDAALTAGAELSIESRAAAAAAWRGPLLDGFSLPDGDDFERWLQPHRERAARAAVRLRAELALACEAAGDADGAIAHLQQRLQIDDADEAAHMELMRLLAARGRRIAALAQYESCRAALLERLGARPSAPCFELYRRIHADAPHAGAAAGPVAPAPADDAAVTDAPAAAKAPAGAAAAAAPSDLAACLPPAPRLIGRQRELALLLERLLDPGCRWLTVLGPGGMGKTTLAAVAAPQAAAAFRHGAVWLSGRDEGGLLHDPDAALMHLIDRCHADLDHGKALLAVLDNLETVPAAAVRALARRFAERAPGITVLATSRQRVGDGREWLLELGQLGLERELPADPLSSPAARLLVASARRFDGAFDVGPDGDVVESIVASVGGLPLALEGAGRMVQRLGLPATAAQLRSGADVGTDRVFADSWQRLDPRARDGALRLASLPTEADLELAAVAGVDADAIEVLRDQSWLTRAEGGRFAMHPLQQDFLRRRPEAQELPDASAAKLAAALETRLPLVGPFGDGASPDEAQRQRCRRLGASALGSPAVLATAARHAASAHAGDLRRLMTWFDGAVALLAADDRLAEACELLELARRVEGLPVWLSAGWSLRCAELRVAAGQRPGSLEGLLHPLEALGLGGIRTDITSPRGSIAGAFARTWLARGWPAEPPLRAALGRTVQRCLLLLVQLLSFSPVPQGMARAMLLARAATRHAGDTRPWATLRVILAYGAAYHEAPAPVVSWLLPRAGSVGHLSRHPALQAHARVGECVTRIAIGRWSGVAQQLEEAADAYAAIGAHRGEMEARSLLGKFAYYEGRLGHAIRIFSDFIERSRRRPGSAWMPWGPTGLAECLWALQSPDAMQVQRLLDELTARMAEAENIDNAYTLRRLGLAARLAWRRGDVGATREATLAAVASLTHVRRRGFWAHEGYAGIGECLLALMDHERRLGGALPPLQQAWRHFDLSLGRHGARFPAGRALVFRLRGEAALAQGRGDHALALLRAGVAAAEQQGLRVELARCCEALAAAAADSADGRRWSERARALWHDIAATVPASTGAATDAASGASLERAA